eukprot:TRINITY_DN76471_c0_g1_i1.p1 TRINITY_DN76471_c0_g1~~TRINITY_DN76471_c0_g1_i1.p1  ORF type:complete len:202 (+),score=32.69 TRINITY_DN76471_c0_g1_i1:30-608(+)
MSGAQLPRGIRATLQKENERTVVSGAEASKQDVTEGVIAQLRDLVVCQTRKEIRGSHILKHNLIGIYFSASWSPPDQEFTKILIDSYTAIRDLHGEKSLEIVLVPIDTDGNAWHEYIASMPWVSMPLSRREAIVRLFVKFAISTIPRLVIMDTNARVVCENARGEDGFGFGCDPLAAYDRLKELATERSGAD